MTLAFCCGLLVGAAAITFAWRLERKTWRQLVALLERQRDEARHEMKVYRGLLFPIVAKAETVAGSSPAPASASQGSSKVEPAAGNQSGRSSTRTFARKPFRVRFKQAVRSFNSKQLGIDRLAGALEKQKSTAVDNSEEKSHVSNASS